MALFNIGSNIGSKTTFESGESWGQKNTITHTLELLKCQTSVSKITLNEYNKYWRDNNCLDKFKREAQVIDNCINGVGKFYSYNINDDLISTMTNNLTKEVFKDIKAKVKSGDIYEDVNELTSTISTSKLSFNQQTFKDVFKNLFLYQQIGIKINIVNGFYQIEVLKPYEYNISENGNVEIITGFDNKTKKPIIELRTSFDGMNFINGEKSVSQYFYNLYLDTRFYNKLEVILDYQMCDSNTTKEVELNKTKQFIDRKMWGKNPINSEIVSLVDVPKNKIATDNSTMSAYFQMLASKNSLGDIASIVDMKAKKVVNSFELSRKTLGLGDTGTDFSSSLPYENELTSATVNNYRDYLSGVLTSIVNDLLKRNDYYIDLGQYSLTSEEAVLDRNVKVTQSDSGSINSKIANKLDLDIQDDRVYYEVCKLKIEKNLTMTMDEELKAQELGLLPNFTPIGG